MASVTFESFIKDNKQGIEIPAIQRDYVQGRGFTIEERDKREAFVDKLIDTLADGNDKTCHLEFIYGAVNETSHCFIPLDGQQRLTTLYLLHWVVWQKSTQETQKKYPLKLIAGFDYKTRLSSSSFCNNIIKKDLLPVEGAKTLGSRLQQQPWFSENWNYDPTITAMISMIDFMEEKLLPYNEGAVSSMLVKLCKTNTILFDELNMTDYDLTDSLYIKMNARGKQLTSFENWKSDFIKFLENQLGTEEYKHADSNRKTKSYTYKDYFCYSIEHQWTDLFWTYLKEEYLSLDPNQQKDKYPSIDKKFMNLFDFLCMYRYYVSAASNVKNQAMVDFSQISANEKRKIWQNKEFVDFLFAALDALCKIDHAEFFDSLFYICPEELPTANDECKVRLFRTKQTNLFKLCVEEGSSMELTDLLLFHALLYYCINKSPVVNSHLKSYMRSVRNYFESDIQNIRTRTIVQLNLRVSEFKKYDSIIKEIATNEVKVLSANDCIIEDCSITRGNTDVFKKSIEHFGSEKVTHALSAFCKAADSDRIRVLVSCGYKGTYLGDCIGRKRYFFGKKDRWDVLFISDAQQLSECFLQFTGKISEGKDVPSIIENAKIEYRTGFSYYMLNYDDFLEANKSMHHFAVRNDLDDVDWIALGSFSSNPATAYHTDPLAAAVEKIVTTKNPDIKLALFKQHSDKCPLRLVKDKEHWESYFGIVSRKDGWHVTENQDLISEDLSLDFNIQRIAEEELLLPVASGKDMIQTCAEFIIRVYNMKHCL